jgi:23S rRNA G2069 N7-methylase RlmK/C1962 C5-methylase RlmI
MKDLIRHILHQYINESKEDMGWRDVQTKTSDRLKTHTSVFFTKKFKYIVEVEEYDNHFYLVSFYPKLNKDWYDKQLTRKMYGQDYKDKQMKIFQGKY